MQWFLTLAVLETLESLKKKKWHLHAAPRGSDLVGLVCGLAIGIFKSFPADF